MNRRGGPLLPPAREGGSMRYYCLAFVPAPEGGYAIFSPDFPEITTQGKDIADSIEMAADALRCITEEYAKMKKALPTPSTLEEAKEKMKAELEDLGISVPSNAILYQFIPAPSADMALVKISATFTRRTLELIDTKAKLHGMTRSGFLAAAAQAYV